jgi:hypothetical protein
MAPAELHVITVTPLRSTPPNARAVHSTSLAFVPALLAAVVR